MDAPLYHGGDIAPGTKLLHGGVDYFAVGAGDVTLRGCSSCAFNQLQECSEVACGKIVWLTQEKYIIHRLRS